MKQYEMFELSIAGQEAEEFQPFKEVKAIFSCESEIKEVKGFYAGDGIYKIRFYPQKAGLWRWSVEGFAEGSGKAVCQPSKKAHGMVKADGLHFRYEDGTRYAPFGTTVYAMVHQSEALVDMTMDTLSKAPFNKVRMCVFPKGYDFNHNEPDLFPFERLDGKFDVHQPCLAFWDMLEKRIRQLGEMGIEADLILFHPYDRWGFARMTKEECLVYLDYAVRRLSAIPNIWWSLANEYDLMEHFEEGWWAEFARFIAEKDIYGHLLSNHNFMKYWDFANEHTTHCCLQVAPPVDVKKMHQKYGKPVIYDECCYEGNIMYDWGNISAYEMVHRFWLAVCQGAYCTHGETFLSEDEVLWWSKGGRLRGQSAQRIAFLRSIAEALPGPLTCVEGWADTMLEKYKAIQENPELLDQLQGMSRIIASQEESVVLEFIRGQRRSAARCGDEAWLYYYEHRCMAETEIELPETMEYEIEVIDIWEMTREVAMSGVCGKIKVALPGKTGIAVLATKVQP